MQAKQLTESSWLLIIDSGERFGILVFKDPAYQLITNDAKYDFESLKELEKLIEQKVKFIKKKEQSEKIERFINELPIRHSEFFNLEEHSDGTISYTSTQSSKVKWTAGFWGLKFTRGYISFLSPKLDNLREVPNIGPFKTRIELYHACKSANDSIRQKLIDR